MCWCGNNNFELNASKTKEIVADFRKEKSPAVPLQINGSPIEIVNSFKFLGTVISFGLDRETNTNSIHPEDGTAENVFRPAAEEVWPTA